jgi:hypothetical protein
LLGWGLFVHFVYVRRAVAEGEAAFLLLDGVAARLRAGYPIGKSLEGVADPRYARYAKAVARGLELKPLNRFMRLSIETVKLARLGGLGAEAIALMSRLAIAIYLSFTNARARMKLYDALAIASGAAIVAPPTRKRLSCLNGNGAHRRGELVSIRGEKGWVRSFGLVLLK